jgi:zinc finger SWIM domain-containing protein 3
VFLSGILNTTSRSESANSFFNRFIGYKNTLVEFWIRFVNAVEEQRYLELQNDNATKHTSPVLQPTWALERHGSEVFTFNLFTELQKQIITARDYCVVETIVSEGDYKISTVNDGRKKVREVRVNSTTKDGHCSCMFFELYGIPCCHLIRVLQSPSLKAIPEQLVLRR